MISTEVLGYALQPYLSYVDTCLYESRSLNGLPDIGAYEYSLPLATADEVQPAFSIYPNPFAISITIDVPVDHYKDVAVRISTISGAVILNKRLDSITNTIDVSAFPAGIYVATIVADQDLLVHKLVKM